jgi:hypothetical protein
MNRIINRSPEVGALLLFDLGIRSPNGSGCWSILESDLEFGSDYLSALIVRPWSLYLVVGECLFDNERSRGDEVPRSLCGRGGTIRDTINDTRLIIRFLAEPSSAMVAPGVDDVVLDLVFVYSDVLMVVSERVGLVGSGELGGNID